MQVVAATAALVVVAFVVGGAAAPGDPATAAAAAATAPAAAASPVSAAVAGPVHPMAPYFALRPVLPVKPAFFPPVVDPNAYVDRKAWILSNLFGAPLPAASQTAAVPAPVMTPGPLYPGFGPGYFASKKNSFLNALFAGQQYPVAAQAPTPGVQAKRAAGFPFAPAAVSPFAPSVFAAKKAAFLQKLFETLNATAVPPTPAPADRPSWMDLLDAASDPQQISEQSSAPKTPLSPLDPSYYTNKKTQFLDQLFDNLSLPPPAAPRATVVPPTFWSPFAAPSTIKPTIVPPGFWAPPGVVSPGAMYKQKVALFLEKLFQKLNATGENSTSTDAEKRNLNESDETEEGEKSKETQHEPSVTRRSIGGPFGGPMSFGKPFPGAAVDPQFFMDKKNAFLSKLFASKGIPGPADTSSGSSGATENPFGGLSGFGKPFPGAAVDPQFFADKKSAFLNKLLASKGGSGSGDGSPASSQSAFWAQYGGFYPTPKPTIVPPDFWNPFPTGKPSAISPAPASSGIFGPAVKPTIVPPDFWVPPYASPKSGSQFVDKKAQILDSLFSQNTNPAASFQQPIQQPQQPQQPQQTQQLQQEFLDPLQPQEVTKIPLSQVDTTEEESYWDSFLKELAEALSAPVHTSDFSRRGISPEAAKQQLQDSAVNQLSAIKEEMLSTVNAILQQKAAAPQTPAFPFGKSAYAAYGAAKKAGGAGGPPGGKKGGPPGKGGFPFWGGPQAAPTPDPTEPLQQRLQVLSRAFDSLATLQKDAAATLDAAVAPGPASAPAAYPYTLPAPPAYAYLPPQATAPATSNIDAATLVQMLREAAGKTGDGKAKSRTKGGKAAARSVQFAVRQGQLSLPAGAEELLTAGGGGTAGEHEGGGLQLQASEQDADYETVTEDEPQRRHHHDHHQHHDR